MCKEWKILLQSKTNRFSERYEPSSFRSPLLQQIRLCHDSAPSTHNLRQVGRLFLFSSSHCNKLYFAVKNSWKMLGPIQLFVVVSLENIFNDVSLYPKTGLRILCSSGIRTPRNKYGNRSCLPFLRNSTLVIGIVFLCSTFHVGKWQVTSICQPQIIKFRQEFCAVFNCIYIS